MTMDIKIVNRKLANRIELYIKIITYLTELELLDKCRIDLTLEKSMYFATLTDQRKKIMTILIDAENSSNKIQYLSW